jgi:hypothetical protein
MPTMHKPAWIKLLVLLPALILGAAVLSACSTVATPSAMCGYIVGDGNGGDDAKIHNVVWPNENPSYSQTSEVVKYVPCGPRNYITNDGTVKDGAGKLVGDRFTPSTARTSTNTQIGVYITADWTLNENKDALLAFAPLCFKYTDCATTEAVAGTVNAATEGWNKMLGENFSPALDKAAAQAAAKFDDKIWQTENPDLLDQLGKDMSADFAAKLRAMTGVSQDIFCGSGNSGWDASHKTYTCTNVRITVDKVYALDPDLQKLANDAQKQQQQALQAKQSQADAAELAQEKLADQAKLQAQQNQIAAQQNQARLDAAKKLYGDNAPYWLALQDTLKNCTAPAVCVVNIGGGNNPAPVVAVPTGTPGK